MIRPIEKSEIEDCTRIICESFKTVAQEFNLTPENCPGHTSFIKSEKLYNQFNEKRLMFVYLLNKTKIGYFSLNSDNDGSYKLDNLAVLPEYRHNGYGKEIIDFAMSKVKSLKGKRIIVGIIEENTELKNWYSNLGFKHMGIKKYEYLPFTVGFMEVIL